MKHRVTFTWFRIVAILVFDLFAGCSWKANTDLLMSLKMPATAARAEFPRHTVNRLRSSSNNPTTIEGMHCYLISVAGSGISPGISDEQLGARKNSCFGFGAISEAMGLYELTRNGKTFRVSSGSNRTVRVYGIFSSTLGRSCEGMTLADIFKTATRPRVYQLGETVSDLYRDSKIVVSNTYDATSADDLAELCPSSTNAGTDGDPTGPAPLKGSRLIAFNALDTGVDNVMNFAIDDAGQSTFVQGIDANLAPRGIDVSADHANVILSGEPVFSTGNVLHLPVEVTGPNVGKWTRTNLIAHLGTSGSHYEIGFGVSPYFYLRGIGTMVANRIHDLTAPTLVGETVNPNVQSMSAYPDFVFTMTIDSGFQPNVQAVNPANGTLAGGVTPLTGPAGGSQTSPPVYVASKNWFLYSINENLHLATFNPTTLNLTSPTGLSFGTANFIARMRYDAASGNLYVLTQNMGGIRIYTVPITPAGELPLILPAGTDVGPDPTSNDFVYTADRKYFFFPERTNSVIRIYKQDSNSFNFVRNLITNTNAALVAMIPLY